MRITPLDVRKQEFRKVVRGLDPEEVYAFLATVAEEYETVLTDNKQLRERVLELDEKVTEYRNMEKTLRDTLLTAERVMAEARENARKEGELILRDAHLRAEHEIANIAAQVQDLRAQVRELRNQRDGFLARLRGLAEAQIGLVESFANDFRHEDQTERPAAGQRSGAVQPVQPMRQAPEPPRAPAPTVPADEFAWDVPPAAAPQTPPQNPYDAQQRPAPARPAAYPASEPAQQDRWRDYQPGRQEDTRALRSVAPMPAAAIGAVGMATERAAERLADRPTERVARVVPRPPLEQPTAAPAYPPIAPVETRVDTFTPAPPPYLDEADQVAESVFQVAGEALPDEFAARPEATGGHDQAPPWTMTAAAGQSAESVAPYAADLQEASAPPNENDGSDAQRRHAQTGWSRWAIDKFSKALGDF